MEESYYVWQTEEWNQKEPYVTKKNWDFKIMFKRKKGNSIIYSIILKVAHL